ncbi:calmodulin [Trypanosoma grayi]|uniref:calmodulin n=1 Tax=Trypanosoma grayi TaxID=71804 RepID=UPI0004F4638F|nr:calmodulin [Trypanosoma grayi]KEG15000.1 calmodulin [Trypanosoma grayi]
MAFPPSNGPYAPYGYPPPAGYPMQQQQLQQPPSGGTGTDLMGFFRAVDQSGSGTISVPELNAALSAAGMKFSYATTERLLSMYDRDFDGEVNFGEFQELHAFIQDMRSGFQSRDTNGDGRLNGNEVRVAFRSNGYQLDDPTFQALMHHFDRTKQGGLAFDDYIELSIFITKANNTFRTRAQGNGLATWDFNTFVKAGVSLL